MRIVRRYLPHTLALLVLCVPAVVAAQSGTGANPLDVKLGNPLAADSIQNFIAEILRLVAQIALPFVILALVYTGFLFVTAQGNEEKLKKAKSALLYTVIGALVVLGASVLAEAVEGTINQLRSSTDATPIVVYYDA